MDTIKAIPNVEYAALMRHEYAGAAATLQPETIARWSANPAWEGEHWAMWNTGANGTTLGPVNVYGVGDRIRWTASGGHTEWGKVESIIRGADGYTVVATHGQDRIYVHVSNVIEKLSW